MFISDFLYQSLISRGGRAAEWTLIDVINVSAGCYGRKHWSLSFLRCWEMHELQATMKNFEFLVIPAPFLDKSGPTLTPAVVNGPQDEEMYTWRTRQLKQVGAVSLRTFLSVPL